MPARGRVFLRLVVMMQTLAAEGALSVGCQNSSSCRRVEVTDHPFWMSCINALVVVSCCDAGLLALRRAAELHWLHWSQTRRSDGVTLLRFCSGSATRLALLWLS